MEEGHGQDLEIQGRERPRGYRTENLTSRRMIYLETYTHVWVRHWASAVAVLGYPCLLSCATLPVMVHCRGLLCGVGAGPSEH